MTELFDLKEHSHRRLNLLTGEWILVSPHRTKRPWQGKTEELFSQLRPAYDPTCYLCPGNKRVDQSVNPQYKKCFAFTNDFSSLLAETPIGIYNVENLLVAKSEKGICRVISFCPEHNRTLPDLSPKEITDIIELWTNEYRELSLKPFIKLKGEFFENRSLGWFKQGIKAA